MSDTAAENTAGIQPPTVADVDDWVLSSSSANQPDKQQLIDRANGAPNPPEEEIAPTSEVPAEPVVSTEAKTEEVALEAKDGKKKPTGSERVAEIQARIAAETRALHDARRAREAEQGELDRVKKEREAIAKPAEGEAKAKPTTDDEIPVWSKWEEEEKGTFDEFMAARDAAVLKKTTKDIETRRAADEHARQGREHADAHARRIQKASEAHPDFIEKVRENLKDVPSSPFVDLVVQHHEQGPDLLYYFANNTEAARVASTLVPSRPIADAIMQSDTPVELFAYFAENPGELQRLSGLRPASALVALGEVSAQLKSAKNGSLATVPSVSNAKPPIRPVGGAQKATAKSSADLDFGPEYVAAMNKEDREREKRRYAF